MKSEKKINNPERWITWLVGRRRTQQTARHCVKCRSHEHRHVERTLLARNPGVSGHVHPRVGIDSNMNQYELGSTLSLHGDTSRPSVLPVWCSRQTRLAWEFFVVGGYRVLIGVIIAGLASPEILGRARARGATSKGRSSRVCSVEFALWIFVHGQHLLKPLRLNFVGSFDVDRVRVSDIPSIRPGPHKVRPIPGTRDATCAAHTDTTSPVESDFTSWCVVCVLVCAGRRVRPFSSAHSRVKPFWTRERGRCRRTDDVCARQREVGRAGHCESSASLTKRVCATEGRAK